MTAAVKPTCPSVSRESFALVKGAALLLEDGESGNLHENASPVKQSGGAPDARHKHLHAMFEQLRPEDTIKLVRTRAHTHVASQISKT